MHNIAACLVGWLAALKFIISCSHAGCIAHVLAASQ
jgi:hypothetical protein